MKTLNGNEFNGKIYGREDNYYIFSNKVKIEVTNEDAAMYWESLDNNLKDEFELGYANRTEYYVGNKCRLDIFFKNNEIDHLTINGNTVFMDQIGNAEEVIKSIPKYKEQFNCVLDFVLSNGVQFKEDKFIK